MYYVYLLGCADKRTYIGCTNDLRDRIVRHTKGYIEATKKRLPIKLISYFAFQNEHTAFIFEQYLKSGSGRAFIRKHHFMD
jgi:putative endonuclease